MKNYIILQKLLDIGFKMSSSPIEEAHVYFLQSFKKNEIRKIISSESIDKRPLDVKLNQKYRFYIYDLNEVKDMYKITSRINIADDDSAIAGPDGRFK